MRYQLQDLFRDVIEAATETGIWQTLTSGEKESLMEYFLCHFDAIMKEAKWYRLACCMSLSVTNAGTLRQVRGGQTE